MSGPVIFIIDDFHHDFPYTFCKLYANKFLWDFPVGFASTGLAGAEGNHLEEGPLAFWSPVWDPKNDLKKEPSLAGPLGPLGGHLGPKGLPKGCQKETQRGV